MNRHLTLKQFRYFLAVAETDSVAAASRMLNIAQSAITKSVLELEDGAGPGAVRAQPQGHAPHARGPPLSGEGAPRDRRGGSPDCP